LKLLRACLKKIIETRCGRFGVPPLGGFRAVPPKGGTPNRVFKQSLRPPLVASKAPRELALSSGGRFGLRRDFGLRFGLGVDRLPLQIGIPTFSFLSFVVLLAHNYLYITNSLRLFSAL
jgi:hypothetical protein